MAKQKILIIDDDESTIAILQQMLEKHGFQNVPAYNGVEALEILNSNDDIDGIILDIIMPEMDGRETLQNIKNKAETKDMPILMLTGLNSISDVSDFLTMGANDYMVKPFDEETLISRLQKILPLTLGFED